MAEPIKNTGTLVIDTLRPYDNERYSFPTVLGNEVQGGIHCITSSAFYTEILTPRRQWGMMVYLKDEDKTYQLRPIKNDELGTNDTNWVPLDLGGGGSTQWIDSVIDVVALEASIGTKQTGDRYLVSPNPVGAVFLGKKNQIATWNQALSNNTGGWQYGVPVSGSTLRVLSQPGVIYTFTGTTSNDGTWSKEYQNTVRYIEPTSANGRTFSFTSTDQTKMSGYTYSVYYAKFGTANSGTVSLSIDGNFYAPVYKASNGSLAHLSPLDFDSGIRYQLTYDSSYFQIELPSSGSGVIGPPEDGVDYTDGLFVDFTTSTPVGTAVDRFNEILKFLVPPPAPDLRSYIVTNQSQFVTGGISYNYAAQPLLGITSTTFSDIDSVTLGGVYSKNTPSRRLGIRARSGSDIDGTLNDDVPVHPGQPKPSYVASSFGNGITGSVVLYLNDIAISTVDLGTTYNAIDQTSGGTLTGLNILAATTSKFSNGEPFDSFWYRTGTFKIKNSNPNINVGFNSIQVKHILPTQTITLFKTEFLTDNNTTATFFNNAFNSGHVTTNTKYLSGIEYYKEGTAFQHNQIANNIYANTYYVGSDAGTFVDRSPVQQSNIYNNSQTYTTNTQTIDTFHRAFIPDGPNQALSTPSSVSDPFQFTKVFNVLSSVRKINGETQTFVTAKRTVQAPATGGALTLQGWFIDTYLATSNDLFEGFDDEARRLLIGDYNSVNVSTFTNGNWDSTGGIRSTSDLQIADGRLLYPAFNFSSPGDTNTNPNKNKSGRDYSNAKTVVGVRRYVRAFNIGITPPRARMRVNIVFQNTLFVPTSNNLSSSANCTLEFKLPYNGTSAFSDGGASIGGAATGWLDATVPQLFNKNFANGAGCLGDSLYSVVKDTSGAAWNIDFGTRNTVLSNGWVLLRFTCGPEWKGCLESITVTAL
jgi:hypothetical protein